MFKVSGFRSLGKQANCPVFKRHNHTIKKLGAVNIGQRHIVSEYTPISNQLQLSSCTANATADQLEILKGLEDPSKVEQVSRLFIYYNTRSAEHDVDQDAGCFLVDVLQSIKALGVCRESIWPYDESQVYTKPTLEAYAEANSNTISEFYQIDNVGSERHQDIVAALNANHPVIFGIEVGQELMEYSGDSATVFGPPTKSVGGHAMIITGYRTNATGQLEFYIRNSWGQDFGMSEPETAHLGKGHMWFSSAYIDTIASGDLFVPTRMIDFAA